MQTSVFLIEQKIDFVDTRYLKYFLKSGNRLMTEDTDRVNMCL